jgi:hypothetical protein
MAINHPAGSSRKPASFIRNPQTAAAYGRGVSLVLLGARSVSFSGTTEIAAATAFQHIRKVLVNEQLFYPVRVQIKKNYGENKGNLFPIAGMTT